MTSCASSSRRSSRSPRRGRASPSSRSRSTPTGASRRRPARSLTFTPTPSLTLSLTLSRALSFTPYQAAPNSWAIKYYKGLGTSSAKEAKEYFSELATHRLGFTWTDARDGDLIELAFSKKRVDDRKEWLRAFEPGTHVDYAVDAMTYDAFINKELILFSVADNQRSIPSIMDGFKPAQRKVLYACFERKLLPSAPEMKVAQLAGYVAETTAYHHGEASLHATIIKMAQDL